MRSPSSRGIPAPGARTAPGGAALPPSPLVTTDEACSLLRVHRSTLERHFTAGELPPVRLGRRKFYRRADVLALIDRLALAG